MPIYEGMYFSSEAEYREYLEWKKLEEAGKLPTLADRVKKYFTEVTAPEEIEKMGVIERLGYSLFSKVSDFFSIMWDKVWTGFRKSLSGIVSDVFNLVIKELVTKHTPAVQEKLLELAKLKELPPELSQPLVELVKDGTPSSYVLAFILMIMSRIVAGWSMLSVTNIVTMQDLLDRYKPIPPDVNTLLRARLISPPLEATVDDYLGRAGFGEVARGILKLSTHLLLSTEDVRALFLRGDIDKTERDRRLLQAGFFPEDIPLLEKLYYFIPAPTDLVRMAVREAFSPEYITKYKLHEDFPPEFAEWSKKQGMSDFWAKAFWASHWELPSAMQGFEMLHRRKISVDDLKMLLRALDVMPFWREKLIDISYYPYTRVDVRRMYGAGVLTKDDVYSNYRDLGYDDEKAKKLTEFTVKDALASEKDLAKSDVISAYERKIMTRPEAKDLIMRLGYASNEAEIYLKKSEYDALKKTKEKEISVVQKHYVAGLITYDEARNRLSKLNLVGKELEDLFIDWDIDKEGKLAEVTFKQLQVLLQKKIIDEATFKKELSEKNYSEKHIGWLLELTKKGVVEGA